MTTQEIKKIQTPVRLAIKQGENYLTGYDALPFVPALNLPDLPELPQPTTSTTENKHPWHQYDGFLPDENWKDEDDNLSGNEMYFELKVQMPEWSEPHILTPVRIGDFAEWDLYKPYLLEWRLYKHPDAYMLIPNDRYDEILADYNTKWKTWKAEIKANFTLLATFKYEVDNRPLVWLDPCPNGHPAMTSPNLYQESLNGYVARAAKEKTYERKIKRLLDLPV